MNAGQYLVSKSPLSSGTALAHLLAMQTGGVRTVFASMFSVQIEEPRLFAVQRPKREAQGELRPANGLLSGDEQRKDVSVFLRLTEAFVLTERDELFVCQAPGESVVVRQAQSVRPTIQQFTQKQAQQTVEPKLTINQAYLRTATHSLSVMTQADEWWILTNKETF